MNETNLNMSAIQFTIIGKGILLGPYIHYAHVLVFFLQPKVTTKKLKLRKCEMRKMYTFSVKYSGGPKSEHLTVMN